MKLLFTQKILISKTGKPLESDLHFLNGSVVLFMKIPRLTHHRSISSGIYTSTSMSAVEHTRYFERMSWVFYKMEQL